MTQSETDADGGGIERVRSLVPGLDAVLRGGFLRGGLYMVQGPPGAGKTILASQLLYGHAAEGSRTWLAFVSGIPAGFVNNERSQKVCGSGAKPSDEKNCSPLLVMRLAS